MKNFLSTTKRSLAIFCIVTVMFTIFSVNTSAISANQRFDCDKTLTFVVKTSKKSPSIKFVCNAAPNTLKHRCSRAPIMAISVSPAINGKSFYLISGNGKTIASTLRLQKNSTYSIKISYYVNKVNKCSCLDLGYVNFHEIGGSTKFRGFNGRDIYANGSYYISKTSNCTVSNIKIK